MPTRVLAVPAFVEISSFGDTVLARTAEGAVWSWGENWAGQLGDGTTTSRSSPALVHGMPPVKAIASGSSFSLALAVDGTVWSWGVNWVGQLGTGAGADSSVPMRVVGLSDVNAISAGDRHALALRSNGTVWSWGANESGQLGDGTTANRNAPAMIPGLDEVIDISAGLTHSAVARSNGTIWTWGSNPDGRLGDGTQVSRVSPVAAVGLSGMIKVRAGNVNTIALRNDGTVWTWGGDAGWCCGTLGDPTASQRSIGAVVPGLVGISSISIGGGYHVAATTSGGVLYTWGMNSSGQLGDDGTDFSRATPRALLSPASVVAAAAGADQTIALDASGRAWAWGGNLSGQLGDGFPTSRTTPMSVGNITDAAAVAAGDRHSVVLRANGTLLVWGSNAFNAIGDGPDQGTPVPFPGLSGVIAIEAGGAHNLALKSDHTVWAWGLNWRGQLGSVTPSGVSVTAVQVPGLSNVTAISTRGDHSVALTADHQVWTWGSNQYGQLGDGTRTDRSTPLPVTGLGDVVAISAGVWHTLVLRRDGSVWGWGWNGFGQLADPATAYDDSRPLPGPIKDLPPASAISAGGIHSLALLRDGTLRAWSWNSGGALGDGTFDWGNRIATVVSISGIDSIHAGGAFGPFALMTKVDMTVWAWGKNDVGQVGDGTIADRAAPVVVVATNGAGSVFGNDWFLDLDVSRTKQIPPDKVPALLSVVSGSTTGSFVGAEATVKFRVQDVGNPIYVFGYVPSSLAKGTSLHKDGACVLAQLSLSGIPQAVSSSNLQSYVSIVTSTQRQAVTVLNGVPAANVAGSTFCVGTAPGSAQSVSASNSACVATVPPSNAGDLVCSQPGNAGGVTANAPGALSGLWWSSGESGWGIDFTQRRNVIFAAWYTYDASGNPKWYVASNCSMPTAGATSGTCNGTLYEVNGPGFFGSVFNPNAVNVVPAGSLSVSFASASSASMTYTVGSQTRTVNIARQVFAAGATPGVDYTDLWWNPIESGWGMAITQQASVMFLAWYVYDSSGKPVWYVASNCAVSDSGCTGTLYRTTGPAFGPAFDPTKIQVFSVGSVTLSFSDANQGTLSYTVNGVSGTKNITRQLF